MARSLALFRPLLAPFVAAALAAGCNSGPPGNGVFNPSAEDPGAEKPAVRDDLPVPAAPAPEPSPDAASDTINIVPKGAPAIVQSMAGAIETEANMGDRSPKSKQRDQKQKDVAKAGDAAAAKSKQDAQSRAPLSNLKGRK